jgi:DedD protein
MDQNIKNRLVGIIVIFALAVIFLPMILDGSGVNKDKLEVVIPPQPVLNANPEFEAKIIELNKQVDALPELKPRFTDENSTKNKIARETAANAAASSSSKADARQVQTETDLEPIARTGGDSWVLQVGSFQDRAKALVQRDIIRKSNISAVFIEQFNADNKSSFRVRLGPFINRDQTRVAQNKIKAKYNIDGIIMKYER